MKRIFARLGRLIVVPSTKTKNPHEYYRAVLVEEKGHVHCLLFTEIEIMNAKKRAKSNPEDIIFRSFKSELLD